MNDAGSLYITSQVESEDAASGFSCGKHPLDDYLKRHAVSNDRAGVSRAYVLRRRESDPAALPRVLGFYTLSMRSPTPRQSPMCCRRSHRGTPCRWR